MREDESDAVLWLEAVSGTERAFVVIFDRYRTRVDGPFARSKDTCEPLPYTAPPAGWLPDMLG